MSKRKRAREPASERASSSRFHGDMRVADAVDAHASAKDVLLEYGLPCSECIVAFHESLAEGCAALRLNIDEVVERLNALA
ncbi:MAG: disulfide oxidoreductase [Planctomycetes bacterium]|nr:disulfide oxidoreductase [Planctomycetota bacterium]